MGKPSIFSREYERKMKKRKRTIAITVVLSALVFGIAAVVFLVNGNFKGGSYRDLNINNKMNVFLDKNKEAKKDDTKVQKAQGGVIKQEKPSQTVQKEYVLSMGNGQQIKAIYEVKDNNKKFERIDPMDSENIYDINASGKSIVVFDPKVQGIKYVDIDGNQAELSAPTYTGSDGTVYSKENQLNIKPDYVWCSSPKFIDEENVAYISQLPWFNNENTRYIWIVNVKTKTHTFVSSLSGTNITFGRATDKGLTASIDGKTLYVKGSGEISE